MGDKNQKIYNRTDLLKDIKSLFPENPEERLKDFIRDLNLQGDEFTEAQYLKVKILLVFQFKINTTIFENKVICAACGEHFRQLNKSHLSKHDLTPESYKEKYGLPEDTVLACGEYRRELSKRAKSKG